MRPIVIVAVVSFDEAFSEHFGSLHRFVRRRLGESYADDVAAETFAIAYRRWGDFDQTRPLPPWLYGIAVNVIREHRRAEERRLRAYSRVDAEAASPDIADAVVESIPDADAQRRLSAALAELRPVDRDILLLYAWADLSVDEIAEALAVPVGTVKSRMSRAREKLGNRLGQFGQVGK